MIATIKSTTRDFSKGTKFEVVRVENGGIGGGKVFCLNGKSEIVLLLDEVELEGE